MQDRLLQIGIIGTIVSALCCFTPVLPLVLGSIGLTGIVGMVYRDSVLLPLLALFLLLIGVGIWRRTRQR